MKDCLDREEYYKNKYKGKEEYYKNKDIGKKILIRSCSIVR